MLPLTLCCNVARVSEMLEVMSRADRLQKCGSLKRTHSSPRSPPCQGIEFDHVNVIAPSGKLLARDLTFQVFLALLACIHGLSTLTSVSDQWKVGSCLPVSSLGYHCAPPLQIVCMCKFLSTTVLSFCQQCCPAQCSLRTSIYSAAYG